MPHREICLVRHAIAAERGPEWPDDAARPLTERGIARFTTIVEGLAWLDVVVDAIFTSPLVRATQTAAILSAGLPDTPPITVWEALAPGHEPSVVVHALSRATRHGRVALVGHEPGLGELAGHLLGMRRALAFGKGGACRIDIERSNSRRAGELQWFLTPKVLRQLGKGRRRQ